MNTPFKQPYRPGSARQATPTSECSIDENIGNSSKVVKKKLYNKSILGEKKDMGDIQSD